MTDKHATGSFSQEAMVSRYEEIRSSVSCYDGIVVKERQGLSLILHKGLAAWIWAWIKVGGTPSVRLTTGTPLVRRIENEDVTANIVTIITTIALNNEQENYV